MEITLNGKPLIIKHDQTLATLIDTLSPHPDRIIAEINGNIVKSGTWAHTVLRANDVVELVTFVGGG